MAESCGPVAFPSGSLCLSDLCNYLIIFWRLRIGTKRRPEALKLLCERWEVNITASLLPYLIESYVVDFGVWSDRSSLSTDVISVAHHYLHALMSGSSSVTTSATQVDQELNVSVCACFIFEAQKIFFIKSYLPLYKLQYIG